MSKDKRELRILIQEFKKKGLKRKELVNMHKSKYCLELLMLNSDKSMKELQESVGKSWQNWNKTYKDCYRKLSVPQVHLLATALDMSFNDLYDIISRDIKTQTK